MVDVCRMEGVRLARMIKWWSRQRGLMFDYLAEKVVPQAEQVLKDAGEEEDGGD